MFFWHIGDYLISIECCVYLCRLNTVVFSSTLYVGEFEQSAFAMTSFVDESIVNSIARLAVSFIYFYCVCCFDYLPV